jgi:hypothetical protein
MGGPSRKKAGKGVTNFSGWADALSWVIAPLSGVPPAGYQGRATGGGRSNATL